MLAMQAMTTAACREATKKKKPAAALLTFSDTVKHRNGERGLATGFSFFASGY